MRQVLIALLLMAPTLTPAGEPVALDQVVERWLEHVTVWPDGSTCENFDPTAPGLDGTLSHVSYILAEETFRYAIPMPGLAQRDATELFRLRVRTHRWSTTAQQAIAWAAINAGLPYAGDVPPLTLTDWGDCTEGRCDCVPCAEGRICDCQKAQRDTDGNLLPCIPPREHCTVTTPKLSLRPSRSDVIEAIP